MLNLYINDLLEARFKNHGRSVKEGFDCYGLAIEVSRRLGHELYDLWYEKACPETFSENVDTVCKRMSDKTVETTEQELGNLILFADENGRMVHIGVILEEGFPFNKGIDEETLKALIAIRIMQKHSEEIGNSEMTLDEINEEIRLAREERHKKEKKD